MTPWCSVPRRLRSRRRGRGRRARPRTRSTATRPTRRPLPRGGRPASTPRAKPRRVASSAESRLIQLYRQRRLHLRARGQDAGSGARDGTSSTSPSAPRARWCAEARRAKSERKPGAARPRRWPALCSVETNRWMCVRALPAPHRATRPLRAQCTPRAAARDPRRSHRPGEARRRADLRRKAHHLTFGSSARSRGARTADCMQVRRTSQSRARRLGGPGGPFGSGGARRGGRAACPPWRRESKPGARLDRAVRRRLRGVRRTGRACAEGEAEARLKASCAALRRGRDR